MATATANSTTPTMICVFRLELLFLYLLFWLPGDWGVCCCCRCFLTSSRRREADAEDEDEDDRCFAFAMMPLPSSYRKLLALLYHQPARAEKQDYLNWFSQQWGTGARPRTSSPLLAEPVSFFS